MSKEYWEKSFKLSGEISQQQHSPILSAIDGVLCLLKAGGQYISQWNGQLEETKLGVLYIISLLMLIFIYKMFFLESGYIIPLCLIIKQTAH